MNLEGIMTRLSTLLGAGQVSDCILSLKEEEKMAMIGLLWSWWNARNKANAGEQRRSTDEVTFSARMAMISSYPLQMSRDLGQYLETELADWIHHQKVFGK